MTPTRPSAFYNEIDPKAAAWLRELINCNLIAPGIVDERSITDLQPDDIRGFTQVHFFAGIGGWSYALRLAGWPDDQPVWTGSCPCQPFSSAGKQLGQADERHMWPAMFRLLRECHPECVFGEQVASAIGHGWLDGISADLEGEGYACGATVLGAHSVGAPHIRQRLYWLAHSEISGTGARHRKSGACHGPKEQAGRRGLPCILAHTIFSGLEGHREPGRIHDSERWETSERHGSASGWSSFDLLPCREGKSRRVESGTFPLAHGVPARVVRLRGYGNAIVPQVAAEFIKAFCEVTA